MAGSLEVFSGGVPEIIQVTSLERENPVDSHLQQRLTDHLDIHIEVLKNHGREYTPEQWLFLQTAAYGIVLERNKRAIESRSPEVKEAIEIANELLEYKTDGTFCLDGRIKRKRVYAFVPKMASFIHTPAGENNEFRQGEGEDLELIDESYYGSLLDYRFLTNDVIHQLRDAHYHCLAKRILEGRPGTLQDDHGLFQSVIRMMREVDATKRYVYDIYGEEKQVFGTVTSFNPEDGYLTVGLDRKAALDRGAENGYTHRVLSELVRSGVTIDTKQFTTNSDQEYRIIRDAFDKHTIENFDWVDNMGQSLVQFWRNMRTMRDEGVFDHVGNFIKDRFNNDKSPQKERLDEKTIRQYAVLLVANAYSAYSTNKEDKRDYSKHNENIVIYGESENGPYGKFQSVIVNPRIIEEVAPNTVFGIDLINDNIDRVDEPIDDPTGIFQTQIDYRKAPKLGLAKEIVRADVPWDRIRTVSLKDMPRNWASMAPDKFREYLKKKYSFLLVEDFDVVFKGADRLRGIAIALNRNTTARQLIQKRGYYVPFYGLCDEDRTIQTLFPFVERGYIPGRVKKDI